MSSKRKPLGDRTNDETMPGYLKFQFRHFKPPRGDPNEQLPIFHDASHITYAPICYDENGEPELEEPEFNGFYEGEGYEEGEWGGGYEEGGGSVRNEVDKQEEESRKRKWMHDKENEIQMAKRSNEALIHVNTAGRKALVLNKLIQAYGLAYKPSFRQIIVIAGSAVKAMGGMRWVLEFNMDDGYYMNYINILVPERGWKFIGPVAAIFLGWQGPYNKEKPTLSVDCDNILDPKYKVELREALFPILRTPGYELPPGGLTCTEVTKYEDLVVFKLCYMDDHFPKYRPITLFLRDSLEDSL